MLLLDIIEFLKRIGSFTIKCRTSRVKNLITFAHIETLQIVKQINDDLFVSSGSIRVYCRVRPFLPGQANYMSTIDHMEEGTITIGTPSKNGKGRRSFNFNKVFGPSATQGWQYLLTEGTCTNSVILNLIHGSIFHLFVCLAYCRRGLFRYPTTDKISPRWLQCLYICLWSNRFWKNIYYGEMQKKVLFKNDPFFVVTKPKNVDFLVLLLEWT